MGFFSARSLLYRIMERAVALLGHKKIFSLGPQELRKFLEQNKRKQHSEPPAYIGKKHLLVRETTAGWPVYIISPKQNPAAEQRAVLFIHGGGYILGAHWVHWRAASRLVCELGIPVWFPDYPLLPDHTIQEALTFLAAVYGKILERYSAGNITVLGDSAGADLSLSLCHHIGRQKNAPPIPGKLVLVSPVVMIERNEEITGAMHRFAPQDVMLSMQFMSSAAEVFNLDTGEDNYFNSPIYGDFSRFPKMYIFSGTFECGFPQIEAFIARLRAAGIQPEFYAGKEMMHIWPYIPIAPECREALRVLFDIIRH